MRDAHEKMAPRWLTGIVGVGLIAVFLFAYANTYAILVEPTTLTVGSLRPVEVVRPLARLG